MASTEGFFRGPRAVPLRAILWMNAAGAAAYLWLQPGGFAFGSRSFLEHQVIVPLYFAVSLVAAVFPARWPAAGMISTGFVAGFWATASAVIGAVGTSGPARGMWAILAGALGAGALFVHWTVQAGGRVRLPLGGGGAGAALAAAFVLCAWAPPASTRPLAGPPPPGPEPEIRPGERFRVSVRERFIAIEHGGDQILVDPGFGFDAVSRSGFWTVFDFHTLRPPPWTREGEGLRWVAKTEAFETSVRVWAASDEVHVRAVTSVRNEVSAHLATVMTVYAPAEARVQGVPWPKGTYFEPAHFAAFRGDRLEFLRASRKEKGPFEGLASLEPHDPTIDVGPWRVQVRGWADHASRVPSPTAGWGVSQGAIERRDGAFLWSIASTSIGRGWHAVRTAPGVYVFEAVIGKAARR